MGSFSVNSPPKLGNCSDRLDSPSCANAAEPKFTKDAAKVGWPQDKRVRSAGGLGLKYQVFGLRLELISLSVFGSNS